MLRTGQLFHPASNPASRPRTGASLPGTLASPRTGLAPAGCPQLSLGYVITTRTSLLSWRPSCWTHPLFTGSEALSNEVRWPSANCHGSGTSGAGAGLLHARLEGHVAKATPMALATWPRRLRARRSTAGRWEAHFMPPYDR